MVPRASPCFAARAAPAPTRRSSIWRGGCKAPIVHALRGKEHIEYDNPYDVGMTGLVGFASGYKAMKNCDTLLMLGADFPYRQFFPEDAQIAQIDVRPEALGNRCPLDLGLLGPVKETLSALLPTLAEKTDSSSSRRRSRRLPASARGISTRSPKAVRTASRSTRNM